MRVAVWPIIIGPLGTIFNNNNYNDNDIRRLAVSRTIMKDLKRLSVKFVRIFSCALLRTILNMNNRKNLDKWTKDQNIQDYDHGFPSESNIIILQVLKKKEGRSC